MVPSMKFVLLLSVAVAAAVASEAVNNTEDAVIVPLTSHDLIVGSREKGDKMVAKVSVKASANLWGKKVIREKTLEAPNQEITYVKATDRMKSDGADVEVTSGGIGTDSITLRFKSQRFHGIDFEVIMYAKAVEDESD